MNSAKLNPTRRSRGNDNSEHMNYKIIPLFVVYQGCPNRCVYCNERITAGTHPVRITADLIDRTVARYLSTVKRSNDHIQIAFYGGNFTGMNRQYQKELLHKAESHVREGLVQSIRISTRPDYIDRDCIAFLKRYSVQTVEIGAQSMVDEVLQWSKRGHTSGDVRRAVRLLKDAGIETGVHIMAGLPGDGEAGFEHTVNETIDLRPHMVRIHPTIVFDETELADLYRNGDYVPLSMSEAVGLCKHALGKFKRAGIPVIRLGLQMTGEMERDGAIVAGPHHPAFRSLVESSLLYDEASRLLSGIETKRHACCTFHLNPKDVSDFRGNRNGNITLLRERFRLSEISIETHVQQPRGTVIVIMEEKTYGN